MCPAEGRPWARLFAPRAEHEAGIPFNWYQLRSEVRRLRAEVRRLTDELARERSRKTPPSSRGARTS